MDDDHATWERAGWKALRHASSPGSGRSIYTRLCRLGLPQAVRARRTGPLAEQRPFSRSRVKGQRFKFKICHLSYLQFVCTCRRDGEAGAEHPEEREGGRRVAWWRVVGNGLARGSGSAGIWHPASHVHG